MRERSRSMQPVSIVGERDEERLAIYPIVLASSSLRGAHHKCRMQNARHVLVGVEANSGRAWKRSPNLPVWSL